MTHATLMVGDSASDQNLYYKTHFLAGDPFIYLEKNGHSVLITNGMERGRAEKESRVSEVKTFDDFNFRDLMRELKDPAKAMDAMLVRVAREASATDLTVAGRFPVQFADALRSSGFSLHIEPKLLQAERRKKTNDEVKAIEQAQRATERSVQKAISMIQVSEIRDGLLYFEGALLTMERVRAEVELSLLAENMESSAGLIIAGGPGAADPHWEGEGPIRAGESIIMDVFPRSKKTRYFADMTRTVVKGEPSDTLRSMYESVLRAQEAALAKVGPGVDGSEVHHAVERVFEEDGFTGAVGGPRYIHGTGHGVGLDVHESPGVGFSSQTLEEGDVVTIEPGLYDPEIGGVRIEDMALVTSGGYRNLTQFPKRFEL